MEVAVRHTESVPLIEGDFLICLNYATLVTLLAVAALPWLSLFSFLSFFFLSLRCLSAEWSKTETSKPTVGGK